MEKSRRVKVLSLIALIVAVLGLTIAFAAMSTTLKINGTAEMNPAEWKIYFNDLKDAEIIGGASEVNAPNIGTDLVSIENINVKLTKPGDTVTYKVDLVNDGDIDAKISNIETPTLSEEAKKIIEFKVKYTSDNKEITVDDILRKHTTENVTITIKFKTDVTEKDLPSGGLEIDLSYKIVYSQSDGKGNDHNGDNNTPEIGEKVYEQGEEVSIGKENFYVISDNGDSVAMLTKYNLLVGNTVTVDNFDDMNVQSNAPISTSTPGYGLQSPNAKGFVETDTTFTGIMAFANINESRGCGADCYYGYWADTKGKLLEKYGNDYSADVYDRNSNTYQYVENYVKYLKETYSKVSIRGRLITYNELVGLVCSGEENSCEDMNIPSWLNSTSYWTAFASSNNSICSFFSGILNFPDFYNDWAFGIRPVIIISKSEL